MSKSHKLALEQSLKIHLLEVQVIGVANLGMGGIRVNLANRIPQEFKDIAIKAAKTIGLPVCGVDFILTHLPEKDAKLEDLNPKLIEINECPSLTMYEDLRSDEQIAIIDRYLDFIVS